MFKPEELLVRMQKHGKVQQDAMSLIICPFCGTTYIDVVEIRSLCTCQYCSGNGKTAQFYEDAFAVLLTLDREKLLELALAELVYMKSCLCDRYSFKMGRVIRAKENILRKESQK